MSRTARTSRPIGLLVAASALLLTGCGVSSPGTAVALGGEETISRAQADRAAQALCRGAELDGEAAGQPMSAVPMGYVRGAAVNVLAVEAIVRDLMEEYDVTEGPAYGQGRARFVESAERLPERLREDYVQLMSVRPLIDSVALELGEAALLTEGVTEPSEEQAGERWNQLIAEAWPEDLEIDPRLGLVLQDGELAAGDTAVSVAVSDVAIDSRPASPGEAGSVDALPPHLICGG